MNSTWDSLNTDEREASGKGYDTATPRDLADWFSEEHQAELEAASPSLMDEWDDDRPEDIDEWLENMAWAAADRDPDDDEHGTEDFDG